MLDILVAIVQAACIGGLFYGAYLCIAYGSEVEDAPEVTRYDPVTTHAWSVPDLAQPTRRAHRLLLRPAPPAAPSAD